jgi:hypothetical protein
MESIGDLLEKSGLGVKRKDKLYTFLDEDGEIITQVRSPHHQAAMSQANAHNREMLVNSNTDFYSEDI